jgi:hypothetical protein
MKLPNKNLIFILNIALALTACGPKLNIFNNKRIASASVLNLETAPGGAGVPITTSNLQDGQTLSLYPVLRSKANTFISDASNVSWNISDSTLGQYSMVNGVITFFPTGNSGIVTLTANNEIGSATVPNININYTVTSVPNLEFWVKADSLLGTTDGTAVGTWTDSSKMSANSTQSLASYQPIFKSNVVNGNPVLRFDGINSRMSFPDLILMNTDYTIFAVGARTSGLHENMFLGGTTSGNQENLAFGYRQDSGGFLPLTFDLAHYGNDVWNTTLNYSSKAFEYWTGWFSQTFGKQIFENGVLFANNSAQTLPLISTTGTMIGYWPLVGSGFEGDIAEIIVYDRALAPDEQANIENYLKKKYGL